MPLITPPMSDAGINIPYQKREFNTIVSDYQGAMSNMGIQAPTVIGGERQIILPQSTSKAGFYLIIAIIFYIVFLKGVRHVSV